MRTFFLLAAFCLVESLGAQRVPADSIMDWLRAGDRSLWLNMTDSLTTADVESEVLPELVAVHFRSPSDRPQWAQVSDSVYWEWLQAGLLALESEWDPEGLAPAAFPEASIPRRERWMQLNLLPMALFVLSFLMALAAWWFASVQIRRRISPSFEAADSDQLDILKAIETGENRMVASNLWQSFLRKSEDASRSHPKWLELSATEQELAFYLVQHFSIKEIAVKMSCTVGHLYNVRSSIRKKWNLEPEEDLISAIANVRNADF